MTNHQTITANNLIYDVRRSQKRMVGAFPITTCVWAEWGQNDDVNGDVSWFPFG
jgi:hypothetical protein